MTLSAEMRELNVMTTPPEAVRLLVEQWAQRVEAEERRAPPPVPRVIVDAENRALVADAAKHLKEQMGAIAGACHVAARDAINSDEFREKLVSLLAEAIQRNRERYR